MCAGKKHLQGELAKQTVLLVLGWMRSQCWSEDEEKNQCVLYRKDLFLCLQVGACHRRLNKRKVIKAV